MLKKNECLAVAERYRRHFEGRIFAEFPQKDICLELGNDEGSYYDSSHEVIHLGMSFFEAEDEKDLLKQANYILGHELQHVKSTAASPWEKGIRDGVRIVLQEIAANVGYTQPLLTKRDQDRFLRHLKDSCDMYLSLQTMTQFVHAILNCVEDGRIERIRSSKKVGFHRYRVHFRVTKMWQPHPITDDEAAEPSFRLSLVINQVLNLATLERFQRGYVTHFLGTRFHKECVAPLLPHIRNAITARSTSGMAAASLKIVEHIAPMIAEAAEEAGAFEKLMNEFLECVAENLENFKPSATEENEETQDGTAPQVLPGKSDLEKSLSPSSGEGENDSEESGDSPKDEAKYDSKESENSSKGKPDRGTPSTEGSRDLSDDEIADAIKEIEEALEESADAEVAKKASGAEKEAARQESLKREPARKVPGAERIASRYPEINFRYIEKRIYPDMPLPPKEAAEGAAFRREIEEMFPEEKQHIIGSAGSVSSKTILNLAMGKTEMGFELTKKEDVKEAPAFFCLIDNSGSMSNGPGSLRWKAASAMSVVEEGLREIAPIRIESFTSHGNNVVVHEVIKDFDDTSIGNFSYNWMQKSSCAYKNKDGWSIRMAASTLADRPEEEKVLFVFSDGYPNDYLGGIEEGMSDVYDAVAEAREAGLHVIGIFMYSGDELDEGFAENYRKMYGKDIVFANSDRIRPEITRLVKSFL